MSHYRFEAKVISRGAGRSTINAAAHNTGKSAIKAAAYRMRMAITDERTGEVHDYSKKFGGAGAEMFLPERAPDWMRDRQRLWNSVEKADNRRNSQLAHDFVISLPYELTTPQRRTALRTFIKATFTDKGKIADVGYHDYGEHIGAKSPKVGEYIARWKAQGLPFYELSDVPKHDDHPHIAILRWKNGNLKGYALFQPHAHVMVPMRSVDPDGPHCFARLKDRAPEGMPYREWWKAELETMRKDWADTLNRHLEAAGRPERVDHRSLADQGIKREPEPKKGPVASKREREGLDSNAVADLQAAQNRNAQRQEIQDRIARLRVQEAEIISLIDEKRKRWQMENEREDVLDRRVHQKQVNDQLTGIKQAENIVEISDRYKAEWLHEHEEAMRLKRQRDRNPQAKGWEGDINDARGRYLQSAERYDIRRPYSSMAEIVGLEGSTFQRQQQELRRDMALERDPLKKESLGLRMKIEANEYMALTSRRLASISRIVTGDRYSEESGRQEERADYFAEQATQLRRDRLDVQERIERQEREKEAAHGKPMKEYPERPESPFAASLDFLGRPTKGRGQSPAAEASLQQAAQSLNDATGAGRWREVREGEIQQPGVHAKMNVRTGRSEVFESAKDIQRAAADHNPARAEQAAPAREMTDKEQRREAARENFDRVQNSGSRERDQVEGNTYTQAKSRGGRSL